jgi:large subunit ribosomal protein L24
VNIGKGDKVAVIAGKDKGKQGTVRHGLPVENKVVVAELNVSKKHVKKGDPKRRPGIIDVEMPIHVSNVMLVCPECGAPTRIGHRPLENGTKARFCKKCNEIIPEPRERRTKG